MVSMEQLNLSWSWFAQSKMIFSTFSWIQSFWTVFCVFAYFSGNTLTRFQPVFRFYTPWKHKTSSFLLLSGGIEVGHQSKMGYCFELKLKKQSNSCSFIINGPSQKCYVFILRMCFAYFEICEKLHQNSQGWVPRGFVFE